MAGSGTELGQALNDNFVAELRWLPEIDTKRQLEGDYFRLEVVYQF